VQALQQFAPDLLDFSPIHAPPSPANDIVDVPTVSVGKVLGRAAEARRVARRLLSIARNDATVLPTGLLLRLRLLLLLLLFGADDAALVARNNSLDGSTSVNCFLIYRFCWPRCQAEEHAAHKQWANYSSVRYLAGNYLLHFQAPI
jgi:hypothetical protein